MATKFPLQINNVRFQVNPTTIGITKAVNYGTLNTQSGVRYQVWYDAPEVLTFSGVSAGTTAYSDLVNLRQNFQRMDKTSQLFYKTQLYQGFLTNVTVEASTNHPNEFEYTVSFQLLFGEKFGFEDFSINATNQGAVSSAIGRIESIINQPLNGIQTSVGKLLSKI